MYTRPVTLELPRWRFAREETDRLIADDTRVWIENGFEPGRVYEVTYRTRVCPVVGAGLLAVRDAAPFPNPPKGMVDGNKEIKIPWDFVLKT